MGPNRILNNRRGYVTETIFDADRGIFTERPFPPSPAIAEGSAFGETHIFAVGDLGAPVRAYTSAD